MADSASRLASRIDADAVIALTRDLVRIPSVNDAGRGEAPAAALVAEVMRSFGWSPVIEQVEPGRPNVHAVIEGGLPGPTLLFEGHTDVVTEGDPSEWSVDPYAAEIRDGRIYGRGSADMKSGVAAMLHAVRALEQDGPFPGRIVVAVLVDEEGMMRGAKHFVAAGHAAGVDAAIVCEPEAEEVCLTSKGSLRLRVDFYGKMAHGAMPQHGRNPIPGTARLLSWLMDFERRLQDEHGEHQHLGWPMLTPTVVHAGRPEQINVIPAHAWLAIDIRTIPGVEHTAITKAVDEAAQESAAPENVTVQVAVLDDRPSTETPEDSAVARAVIAAHEAVTGQPARLGGVPGATDGTILWRDAGLPVVVYGPGGKWIAHQADEFVEVDDIVRKARTYAVAASRFLTAEAQ